MLLKNSETEKNININNTELVYLTTPYSHPNPKISEERFKVVNKVAAALLSQGIHLYSPISHTHDLDIPVEYVFPVEILANNP